ncbi:MAG TPA: pilus assembly protein TadG-related protein [Silvibacterium sp.]|nr:pilus assembly protein TadG-related protein [Silvibacterium sp.]
MRSMRDESGQALILTATSLLVLMGFLALATDVGILFHDRRELQTAADGAAVAAAMEYRNGGSDAQATASAVAAATSNGFTDSANGVTVTIHTPPVTGFHQSTGNVEVDISQAAVPTVFMGLFGSNTVDISARAVATYIGVSKSCIWLGHSTGTDLTIRGAAKIIATNCGIYLNSTSSDSIKTTGNGNTIDSPYIDTPGGTVGSGTPQGTTVSTGTAPQDNPFNTITGGNTVTDGEPNAATACTPSNTTSTALTPTPGKFSGTIDLDPSGTTSTTVHCFSDANVDVSGATLSNGVFVFENGVKIGTNSTFTMTNATLDLDQGVFNEGSQSIFDITAPKIPVTVTPKQWNNGIAVLVPPTNTTYSFTACNPNPNDTQELMIQFGSANQTFSGYIYAPNATVTLHDQGGGTTAAGLVAASLCDLSGNIDITGFNALNPTTSPLTAVTLVE